ncbi:MAG: TetR family transcriptional regulator [Dermatophilaceae bacterium]
MAPAQTTSPTSRGDEPAVLGLRERKKAKTKAAIQHHALRLFQEQGYAETTVEQIAEAAEVSPSTFFRYFPTKEETVLTEFLDSEAFRLMVQAPAQMSPLEALRNAVERTFGSMSEEDLRLELTRNQLINNVPELRRGMLAELTRPMGMLAEAVALRLGRDPEDPGIRMYAGAVVGAITSMTASPAFQAPRTGDADAIEPEQMQAMMTGLGDAIGALERIVRLPD